MTPLKYLSILTFFTLTVTTTASCQVQKDKDKNTTIDKPKTFRQLFWDSLPKPIGYVNDYENIYSDREEEVLDSLIKAFENKTTIQIAVITIDTSMTTKDSLDALTLHFGNTWGVGQKGKNNGMTIGISRGYRRMRIQNGYGIEKILTDEETKQIIDTVFIPSFRDAKYFDGTFNGLVELMNTLGQRYR
jgi:uncharacterized protein